MIKYLPFILFLVPFVLYALYLAVAVRRDGGEAREAPTLWLFAAALALALVGIVAFALDQVEWRPSTGETAYEDGRGVYSPTDNLPRTPPGRAGEAP